MAKRRPSSRPVQRPAPNRLAKLRRDNTIVGTLHLVQAVAIVFLTNDLAFPVFASFLAGDPVASQQANAPELVFELHVGYAVAAFLFLAAADHLLMTVGPIRAWYERNLGYGRNHARWAEYSVSASLMLILIAMLAGIWDLAALIALFALNASMILFGAIQERDHQPGGDMHPFWFGTAVGLVPWLTIGVYLLGGEAPPTFVYVIFVSLFLFFMSFGINQLLQYRKVGRWVDYVHGERVYVLLSLVAKSLLAWQVFANVLRS